MERRIRAIPGPRLERSPRLQRRHPAGPRGVDDGRWLSARAGRRERAEHRHGGRRAGAPADGPVQGRRRGSMTIGGAPRLASVELRGPAGRLEGLLQERHPGTHDITAVVLHPHPLYGGTLNNKVVHRVAGALYELGAAVLRINFRGVGRSEGRHDQGVGEVEDARAAWDFMSERWPKARRWLAGFSFGSWIAARLAPDTPELERLLLVAPPVTTSSFEPMHTATVPKIVIQGTRDDVCPFDRLTPEFAAWAPPKRLVTVEGATHFFDRKLDALATTVRQVMTDPVG